MFCFGREFQVAGPVGKGTFFCRLAVHREGRRARRFLRQEGWLSPTERASAG